MLLGLDLAEMLKEAGASIIGPVASSEEAIALVRTTACSAAIIDFRLGSFNAMPIGQELQEREVPFVIHTGYDCLGVLPRHWRGCKVVIKPAATQELIRTVAVLVRWRLMRQRRSAATHREH